VLTERRVVRSIKYEGMKSVTVSEILDRFKDRRVGLSVESQYDPNRVQRAVVVLKEFLAERGRQYAKSSLTFARFRPPRWKSPSASRKGPRSRWGSIDITGTIR
jgi:outer membrane protein insertion porin family